MERVGWDIRLSFPESLADNPFAELIGGDTRCCIGGAGVKSSAQRSGPIALLGRDLKASIRVPCAAEHNDMADWLDDAGIQTALDNAARVALAALRPQHVPQGSVIFQPGTLPMSFPIILHGRIGVYLTGKSGRELFLYGVSRGETCVQTSLGLLGDEPYSAEAIAETDLVAVLVPKTVFQSLLAISPTFRDFVFRALAGRIADVMFVLEQVAFVRIESRLASALLSRMKDDGVVLATHHDLAVQVGTAREVVSRHLKALASKGFVSLERGSIRIERRDMLRAFADE